MALDVVAVPVLTDNYVWLVHDPDSGETLAVDPGESAPVLAAAEARGWRIGQVWNTHWHPDHTGGNDAVRAATGARVTGPAAEADRISTLDATVAEGDTLALGRHVARVIAVPTHTNGHIAFHFEGEGLVFVGDTLFAMGVGRFFEGTAETMFPSLRKLDALPGETKVYAGHEYTEANARFAVTAEPDNDAIRTRLSDVAAMREVGTPTLPTTIALEQATNPFLRAPDAARLAELRAAKDAFRG